MVDTITITFDTREFMVLAFALQHKERLDDDAYQDAAKKILEVQEAVRWDRIYDSEVLDATGSHVLHDLTCGGAGMPITSRAAAPLSFYGAMHRMTPKRAAGGEAK